MTIYPKSSWTMIPKVGKPLTGPLSLVVIHHPYPHTLPQTATYEQECRELRAIDRFHREEREWAGGGYSFCIFQSGRIYEMRGWLRSGAHTETKNFVAHGVAFVVKGNIEPPSPVAISAAQWLIGEGVRIGAIGRNYQVAPHDQFKQTVCPGSYIKEIMPRLEGLGQKPRLLGLGMRGDDVKVIQQRLRVRPVSGYFGPLTDEAVRKFQQENGLTVDGIVGPQTLGKLKI